jgi:hypothetical protein
MPSGDSKWRTCAVKRGTSSQIFRLKHIDVRMVVKPLLSGEKYIHITCVSKGCPLACALTFRTPIELWSVKEEKFAALLSLPCARLAKEAAEIAKQDGHPRVTSLAEKVGK